MIANDAPRIEACILTEIAEFVRECCQNWWTFLVLIPPFECFDLSLQDGIQDAETQIEEHTADTTTAMLWIHSRPLK